ncbi:hypothetical protein ccbrp13_56380 [Ktedonobacteria bacterium brp13]|nr:hypothetical protein ccbrp13_56380 [Ktedonobacteria bacterium brp13]
MTSSPIAGHNTQIYLTSGTSIALTNEAMSDSGDHLTFNVTNAAHQCWDSNAAFVVQTSPDGVTWTTVTTGFTINYPIGRVVFATAVSGATPSCRISSGKYFVFSFMAYANVVDPSLSATTYDVTSFTNPPSGWKTFIAGVNSATIKLTKFWIDGVFLAHLTSADLLIIQIYPGQNANQRFQGYGILTSDAIKSAQNAVNTEDLNFTVNGQLFFIPS